MNKLLILILLGIALGPAKLPAQVLEEIIVTAQKRQENIQDVPISISAYGEEFLSDNSIKDVIELMTSVPGLIVGANQSSSTGNFAIRGVGTGAQNFGLESSVGLYIDGIYRARQSSMINQLIDVEAIEVLRGPQGTLFGKNSASGAVLIRTVQPSHETDGFIEASFGNHSLINLSGAFNLSLSENLASRTTLFLSSRDGFVNDITSGEDLNDRDRKGFRQQFLFTPTDTLSVRAILDYSEMNEACCGVLVVKDSLIASDRTDNGNPIPGTDAIIQQLGGTVYRTGSFEDYELALNQVPDSSNSDFGFSAEINWDINNHTLTSITSYRDFDISDAYDADFTDVQLASRITSAEQSALSQEIRLSSSAEKRLRYIAGIYAFKQDLKADDNLTLESLLSNYVTAASPDVLQPLINAMSPQLIGFINAAYLTSFGSTIGSPIAAGNTMQDVSDQTHKSIALFGRFDFDINDWLTINAGIRYTDESKDLMSTFNETVTTPGATDLNVDAISAALGITGAQALAFLGAPPGDGTGGTFNAALAALDPTPFLPALNVLYVDGWANCSISARFCPRDNIDEELNDDRLTGDIGLSVHPDDTSLVYINYGTGYKSGGTNTDRIDAAFDVIFGAEDTTTLELGVKKDFPEQGLRFNAALYDMDVEDLQTNTFTGTAFNLQNAGKVKVQGLEAEMFFYPEDTIGLSIAYAYTSAKFKDFDRGNCQISNIFHTGNASESSQLNSVGYCDRSDDRVANVSKHFLSVNGEKAFQLSSDYDLTIGVEYVYYSNQFMHNNNDPFSLQDGVGILNMRAVLNTPYDIKAMLWARNLTDESWFGTVFDTPLQDGKLTAYPREPRTFGITLRKDF